MTFWDKIARYYDLAERVSRKTNAQALRQTGELVPQWASVLDCAAGTGEYSLAAAERAGAVMCTDLSRAMLDEAERKAGRRGIANMSFLVRDLMDLPEGDGTYDVVIAANVLHLLPDPRGAARELWRVTAPGGRLLLPTFLQGEADLLARGLLGLYKRLGFRPRRRFTLESYRRFLRELGLPAQVSRIPGHIPMGFGVCEKPL